MDWKMVVIQLAGGIGLFLMGMKIMSEGLQKVAGDGLRKILNILTTNRFLGIFVGLSITTIIQSSSATTVMAVSFVNAGLMTLRQAIGVIFGANIGTTITAWIVILPIVKYNLVLIGISIILVSFFKKEKIKFTGEILFGLGILFMGMETMTGGMVPLRESKVFNDVFLFVNGSTYPILILGVVIGALTTMAVQSSSVTIGIAIALATNGLINYHGAVSLILGDNIGTTITAVLASLGATRNAKRAALAHAMFNVLGVVVILIIFYPFTKLVDLLMPYDPDLLSANGTKPYIGQHIALAHSMFNVANVVFFTGFIPLFVKICEFIIPVKESEKSKKTHISFTYISAKLLDTPSLALIETEKELANMSDMVVKISENIHKFLSKNGKIGKIYEDIETQEKQIDDFQKRITEFLLSVSQRSVSRDHSILVGNYITLAHNLEKYADYVNRIGSIFDKLEKKNLELTKNEYKYIKELNEETHNFFIKVIEIYKTKSGKDTLMDAILAKSRKIRKMVGEAKLSHLDKLGSENACKRDASVFFIDILNCFDGMRREVYNIGEVVTGTKYS
ncbi:MAG: Na/Pi cotransporter family protein [Spirochaetes bacterium]|nr:Na/Pi cotransporter family protein [Spirochaetota bacterium]